MALFFRTHECNLLCSRLQLQPFERCATDVAAQVGRGRDRQMNADECACCDELHVARHQLRACTSVLSQVSTHSDLP